MAHKTSQEFFIGSMAYIHDQPESLMSKIIKVTLRVLSWRKRLEKSMTSGSFNQTPAPLTSSIRSNFTESSSDINNRKIWQIQPGNNASSKVVLFIHGGAYVYNITKIHWQFIEQLIIKTSATVVVPDYPLAPQAKCQEAYSFIDSTYTEVLKTNSPEDIILLGDSAGAGLALGFAQKLRNEKRPLPQQIILISPWLDITMTHPDIRVVAKKDKMLSLKGLQLAGKAYAGGLNQKNYMVSPIYGDFHNLPKVSLFIGTHDVLISDSRRFQEKMKKENFPVNYFEYPKMFHDWVLIPHLKEAKQAMNQISKLINI